MRASVISVQLRTRGKTALRLGVGLGLMLGLGACGMIGPGRAPAPDVVAAPEAASVPKPAAATAEAFDTTTAAERAAATAAPKTAGTRLGTTIASLGDPTEEGFWLKTGLVTAPATGRVVLPATGASVSLELIPSGAAPGAGSQMSLPALRLLGVGLTDLPEVEVFGP